jgi:hypothetical protein
MKEQSHPMACRAMEKVWEGVWGNLLLVLPEERKTIYL